MENNHSAWSYLLYVSVKGDGNRSCRIAINLSGLVHSFQFYLSDSETVLESLRFSYFLHHTQNFLLVFRRIH